MKTYNLVFLSLVYIACGLFVFNTDLPALPIMALIFTGIVVLASEINKKEGE